MPQRYVQGPAVDDRIVMYTVVGGVTKHYYHANHQGSVVAMSDTVGALAEQFTYDAYGQSATLIGNPFRYTGRYLDAETGLYYYRARYYSPALGRFLQTDPVGYTAGLNWYAYVGNDPVNATDPSGEVRASFTVGATFVALGGAQGSVSFSIDTETGEISVALKASARTGAQIGVKVSGSITESEKLGNRVSAAATADTQVGNASGAIKVETGVEVSSDKGLEFKKPEISVTPSVSADENGFDTDFKPGRSAGVGVEVSANLSIPDTLNNISDAAGAVLDALKKLERNDPFRSPL